MNSQKSRLKTYSNFIGSERLCGKAPFPKRLGIFGLHRRISMDYKPIVFALIYMVCSSGIIFSNKIVLTSYRFPSYMFLALAQTAFTFGLIRLLFFNRIGPSSVGTVLPKVFPLSCCYAVDIAMGIAGTGSLNLPMFSALRRVSNLFILVGEQVVLSVYRPLSVYLAVCLMVFGATVAAIGDMTFDLTAYGYVFGNNLSTAAKALLTKSRLRDQGFSSVELLYYNSGFMIPFLALIVLLRTDVFAVVKFEEWSNPVFVCFFIFSCCSAVLLNYSLLQCTHYTSALTTSIIGVIKNVMVTYAGMFVGGDYVYTKTNFVGVTISALGAVTYVIVVYRQTAAKSAVHKVTNGPIPTIVTAIPTYLDQRNMNDTLTTTTTTTTANPAVEMKEPPARNILLTAQTPVQR